MGQTDRTITEVCIPSSPSYLASIRRIAGCLAGCAGMDLREIQDAKLAVSEACAGAIRADSSLDRDERISVRFSSTGGTIEAEVRGFPEGSGPESGDEAGPAFGIALVRTLTDEVQVSDGVEGTIVRLVKRAGSGTARYRSSLR